MATSIGLPMPPLSQGEFWGPARALACVGFWKGAISEGAFDGNGFFLGSDVGGAGAGAWFATFGVMLSLLFPVSALDMVPSLVVLRDVVVIAGVELWALW